MRPQPPPRSSPAAIWCSTISPTSTRSSAPMASTARWWSSPPSGNGRSAGSPTSRTRSMTWRCGARRTEPGTAHYHPPPARASRRALAHRLHRCVAQLAAQHLADVGLWQLLLEDDVLGLLVAGELLGAELHQRLLR